MSARPLTFPLSARWFAAAWSPKGDLPIALKGDMYTSGLKSLDNPAHWLDIDPNPQRHGRIVRLREALLDPGQGYFDSNFAAEDGTTSAQEEALYRVLAEVIRW